MTDKEIMQEAARLSEQVHGLALRTAIEKVGNDWSAQDVQCIMSIAAGMSATALLNIACACIVEGEKADFLLGLFPSLFDVIRSVAIEQAQRQETVEGDLRRALAGA